MLSPTTLKVGSASWDSGVVSGDKLDKSGDAKTEQDSEEVEQAKAGNAGEAGEAGDWDETGGIGGASESDIGESGNKRSGMRLKLAREESSDRGENAGVDGLASEVVNPNHLETYCVG